MTALAEKITRPGLITDMPFDTYLADPVDGGSLSHSGMKTLVKATPALYAYEREHGRPDTKAFDRGHAAHQMVLGVGPDIVAVDAVDWRTKAAKEAADEIRAAGGVPILRAEFDAVRDMADALRRHPLASKMLEPGTGEPEVSAFALDPDSGVWLRARFDWWRPAGESGKAYVIDYKTAKSAHPDRWCKSVHDYGYDLQDATYLRVANLLALAETVAFLFVVQETTPPYLPNVIELDHTAKRIGQIDMRDAIALYKHCSETGHWPGYGDQITHLSLPAWVERTYEGQLT